MSCLFSRPVIQRSTLSLPLSYRSDSQLTALTTVDRTIDQPPTPLLAAQPSTDPLTSAERERRTSNLTRYPMSKFPFARRLTLGDDLYTFPDDTTTSGPPSVTSLETLKAIEELVKQKQIRKAVHPSLPLAIYNYTHHVQFRDTWSDLLLRCRGLVLDTETGETVACPMRKFFNYSEKKHDEATFRIEECDVVEKLDGSLGIFFKYRDEWEFASRGSFISRQAKVGEQMSNQLELYETCNPDYTYLFEIIYPSNRVVVDYADSCELVLIAVVHTQSGLDLPLSDVRIEAARINVPFPKVDTSLDSIAALQARNISNEEGYVIRSRTTGERVKLKFEEYLELHAIRTQFSRKYVRKWFLHAPMGTHHLGIPEDRVKNIPDEHYQMARDEWARLDEIRATAEAEFEGMMQRSIDLPYAAVEMTPMKNWICKYLRLSRQGQEGVDKVAHEYAMSVVRNAPEIPDEPRGWSGTNELGEEMDIDDDGTPTVEMRNRARMDDSSFDDHTDVCIPI